MSERRSERPDFGEMAPGRHERDVWMDEPIELSRFLDAIRQSRSLILGLLAVITGAVLIISLVLPDSYRATAKVILTSEGASASGDSDFVRREISTMRALVSSPDVLRRAAARLQDETKQSLEEKIQVSVDSEANVVNVAATDSEARQSATIANTVASTFLLRRAAAERQRLGQERAGLLRELEQLSGSPGVGAQLTALRERLGELAVMDARVGSELELEFAEPPSERRSPHPIRNTVLAFLAAVLLAVLVALARQSLAPHLRGLGVPRALVGGPDRHRVTARASGVERPPRENAVRAGADLAAPSEQSSNDDREQEVLELLTSLGRPVKEEELRSVLTYSRSTILRHLDRLVERAKVRRSGTGRRGDPYLYERVSLDESPADDPGSTAPPATRPADFT